VVVNTRDRSGIQRVVLGSLADTLIRTSPVPVVCLRVRDL
jgi:nucleotide-binding universal stress UspA family protein